ncbi:MAG: alcohol dehydrogenase [Desulfobacterales bacterium CG23_combo_of_CG06-09_8_20_14_all_52_9]|nr:MAG: alcohol dehydrogenase [Desulfobacterales bacterium CG23_combo_of_CG06-09_8_20_14_all_52_9]
MFRNFKTVSRVLYGRGSFDQLEGILQEKRKGNGSYIVFILDDVFKDHPFRDRIPALETDRVIFVSVDEEPTTAYVDDLTLRVQRFSGILPAGVVGIGGGSTMDLAKAVSLMLTNPGSSADYQGWDLIRNPAIYHVGVPTLSGTGAEVSRTTVLIGPQRKLGINSDHTVFDQIVLDPDLIASPPADQRFYTGMDCYIHCVESLTGTYLNAFSKAYGEKAMTLCREVFLTPTPDADEKMMMASYFGGMSIVYSQVGVCHALSYGLSFVLGIHHGIGNCIVFNQLEEFYPEGVREFRRMMDFNGISLPENRVFGIEVQKLEKMIDVSLTLDPLWENALGKAWKSVITRDRIKELYLRM